VTLEPHRRTRRHHPPSRTGRFGFIAVEGWMDFRTTTRGGRIRVEFTWEGADEGDHVGGQGWAVLADDGAFDGRVFFHLGGDPGVHAIRTTAHRLIAARRKSTAVVLGNLALAAIRQHRLEQATARMHAAIDVVEATRGGAGLTVVFSAARELRPWRAEPAVQDLDDRLLTLTAA
jgi:hypothetical protein